MMPIIVYIGKKGDGFLTMNSPILRLPSSAPSARLYDGRLLIKGLHHSPLFLEQASKLLGKYLKTDGLAHHHLLREAGSSFNAILTTLFIHGSKKMNRVILAPCVGRPSTDGEKYD